MTEPSPPPSATVGGAAAGLTILYRDEDLLAVAKPSGMVVHRGWARDRVVAMSVARDLIGQHVYPLHRLDRGTSGVLLFALSPPAAARLQAVFAAGGLAKTYVALVRGITPPQGVIDHPLPRTKHGPRVAAVTHYRRLGVFERYSLVAASPLSGRLHQIRRHLKHLSHPLIGDVRYGKGEHNRLFRQRFALHRLALHALQVELVAPAVSEPLTIRAEVPSDLAEPLSVMGLLDLVRVEPGPSAAVERLLQSAASTME